MAGLSFKVYSPIYKEAVVQLRLEASVKSEQSINGN